MREKKNLPLLYSCKGQVGHGFKTEDVLICSAVGITKISENSKPGRLGFLALVVERPVIILS